jgi:uncharacterized membrane protein YphA (DoxX/SURF4 family)
MGRIEHNFLLMSGLSLGFENGAYEWHIGFGSATKPSASTPFLLNRSISFSRALDLLGRICIAALFVNALPGKMSNFSGTAAFIASKGIPEPLSSALLVCAMVVLIVGSVFLVFGGNTIFGASLLLIFLVPTTLIFHTNPLDLQHLFTNLAVIGALILAITRSTGGSVPSFRSLRARRR